MVGGEDRINRSLTGIDELGAKRIQHLRRNRIRLIVVAVLVLSAAVFAVWSIVFILTSEREAMRLSFLTQGSVDVATPCSLVFLDDAQALTAPGSGLLVPLAGEGERVGKGGRVALVVPLDREAEVSRYREARASYQADLLLASGYGDASRYPLPLSPADSQLRGAIAAVARSGAGAGTSGQVRAMAVFRDSFHRARSEAALLAKADPEIDQLQAECDRLISLLEGDGRTLVIQSPLAGELAFSVPVSSAGVDLVEGDPQRVVDRLSSVSYESRDLSYQRVEAGDRVATVSRFSGRNLVAWLAERPEWDQAVGKGTSLAVRPEPGEPLSLDCTVTKVERVYDGLLLYLSCPNWSGYGPDRLAVEDAVLVTDQLEGLRLPLSGLMDLDLEKGSARLRTVKGGITRTIPVRIRAADDRYAIIESDEPGSNALTATDLYVVNPWTTEDGVLID